MTPQESIKIIEIAKTECEWNAPLDYQTAFDMAIKALEKQIPKKPTLHEGWLYCSVCKKDILMEGYKFCPDCGQRIDWMDDET